MATRPLQALTIRKSLETRLSLSNSIHCSEDFKIDRFHAALGDPPDPSTVWMRDRVLGTYPGEGPLRVLLVGTGDGRCEVPFVLKMAESRKFREISVTSVDYGKVSNSSLRELLTSKSFSGIAGDPNLYRELDGCRVALEIVEEDFLAWHPATTYDVVVAFFVVNFLKDWMEGLRKLLAVLDVRGSLFLSEDADDIRFVDNRFWPIDNDLREELEAGGTPRAEFHRFWQRYYELRNSKGFAWYPLISPADMGVAFQVLDALQSAKLGETAEHTTWWTPAPDAALSWADWIDIVNEGYVFNCLSILPPEYRREIAGQLENLVETFKTNGHRPAIRVGHVLKHFASNCPFGGYDALLRYVIEAEYLRSAVEADGNRRPFRLHLKGETTTEEEQVRRLVRSREQLPSRGNIVLSIVSWSIRDLADPREGGWSPHVPVMFSQQFGTGETRLAFCLSYGLYMCAPEVRKAAQKRWSLLSDEILHHLRKKIPIRFRIGEERADLSYFKDGTPSVLEIELDDTKVKEVRGLAETILMSAGGDVRAAAAADDKLGYPSLPLVGLNRVIEVKEGIWSALRDQVIELYEAIENRAAGIARQLIPVVQQLLPERMAGSSAAESAHSIAVMAYANAIIGAGTPDPWKRAFFMPANTLSTPIAGVDDDWEVGLVGLICYYSEPEIEDSDAIDTRWRQTEQFLRLNANTFGLEDAIQQYAKLVRAEGIRTAVTAVMARNMSHNIGSHVLAYLSDEDAVEGEWRK